MKTDAEGYMLNDDGERVTLNGFPIRLTNRLPFMTAEIPEAEMAKPWLDELLGEVKKSDAPEADASWRDRPPML